MDGVCMIVCSITCLILFAARFICGLTEQASAIQEITASIDEIAEKTKENAEEANSAAGLVARLFLLRLPLQLQQPHLMQECWSEMQCRRWS